MGNKSSLMDMDDSSHQAIVDKNKLAVRKKGMKKQK